MPWRPLQWSNASFVGLTRLHDVPREVDHHCGHRLNFKEKKARAHAATVPALVTQSQSLGLPTSCKEHEKWYSQPAAFAEARQTANSMP